MFIKVGLLSALLAVGNIGHAESENDSEPAGEIKVADLLSRESLSAAQVHCGIDIDLTFNGDASRVQSGTKWVPVRWLGDRPHFFIAGGSDAWDTFMYQTGNGKWYMDGQDGPCRFK